MGRTACFALFLLALLPAAGPARAQRRLADIAIQSQPLADGVWMLSGAGGNLGACAGPDGVLLVDAEFGPLVPKIRATLDSLSGGRPVRFVVNTHYHGDHTGGDSAFAVAGAAIVAHEEVRRRLGITEFNRTFSETIPAAPREALPALTFRDSLTFHLNGRDLHVLHVAPAHTDGDAIVWIPSADVLQTGDLFFNGTYPVIDVSAGGSIGGMVRAADLLLAMAGPGTKIIPGHGPLGDRAALQRYRDMLVAVRDRVIQLVRAGRSLDEVVAAKPTADLDDAWGKGFMKPDFFVGVVYSDLSRGQKPGRGR